MQIWWFLVFWRANDCLIERFFFWDFCNKNQNYWFIERRNSLSFNRMDKNINAILTRWIFSDENFVRIAFSHMNGHFCNRFNLEWISRNRFQNLFILHKVFCIQVYPFHYFSHPVILIWLGNPLSHSDISSGATDGVSKYGILLKRLKNKTKFEI